MLKNLMSVKDNVLDRDRESSPTDVTGSNQVDEPVFSLQHGQLSNLYHGRESHKHNRNRNK